MQTPIGGRDKRAYHLTSSAEKLEEQLKTQRELYQVRLLGLGLDPHVHEVPLAGDVRAGGGWPSLA